MVAMGGSLGSRTAVRGPSRAEQVPEGSGLSRLPVSVITLTAAIGVFVSSMGYAQGRAGAGPDSGPGLILYWAGQLLILVPISGKLLSRRHLTNGSALTLVVVLTIAEYLLKVNYTPLGFAFNDEFLHWRNTTNMLQTGNLFEANFGLPVGTGYPGLEEVTSALVSATGLPVYEAGLIVAGIAHLLFICFLYMAFCVAIRSHRIAGIAMLIYYGTQSLTSFNSMFIYETLALGFLGFCMVAALRSAIEKSPAARRGWFIVAVLSILATVVTHHVTSYMLTGFLVLVAIASRLTGSRNTAARFGILGAIAALSVTGWILLTNAILPSGDSTINYFSPTITGMIQGLEALQKSGSSDAPSTSTSPILNTGIEAIGLLLVAVLIAAGCWQAWKRHRRHPWIIGMMIGCLGWVVALGIRLGTPDGQELAGRAATYTYIPVSVLAALALTKLVNSAPVRRWGALVTTVVVTCVVTLIIDGLANGWPPFWERLPGPHLVASFEASVGPQEIATSLWTLKYLGPGNASPNPAVSNTIAADQGIYPVLLGYGDQDALQVVSWLYTGGATWTKAMSNHASAQNVHYVETDIRTTQSLPPAGTYFPGDTVPATKTIPLANLEMFNKTYGVARVYDDGDIIIYDLMSQGYVPQPKS